MSNAKTLKHCPGYSIDRDMSKEIVDARKRLWGKVKDTKKENPGSSVRIVYPVKLLCGNRVVQDKFPDWHAALNKSWIVLLPVLETLECKDVTSGDVIPTKSSASVVTSGFHSTESTHAVVITVTQSGRDTVVDLSQPRDSDVPSLFGTQKERVVSTQETDTKSVNNGPQPYPISKDGSHSSRTPTGR